MMLRRPKYTMFHTLRCSVIGIYSKGWTAGPRHRVLASQGDPAGFDDDVWELYGPGDWTRRMTFRKRIRETSPAPTDCGSWKRSVQGAPLDDRILRR